MKSVALHNLGCKVNSYELDVMQQYLQNKGYKIVNFDQKADIYIINTCTVTNIADRKSRQMLHRAKKQNPDAIVVAVGCYVQTNEAEIEKDDCIDLAIGNNRKNELVEIIEAYLDKRQSQTPDEQTTASSGKTSGVAPDKTLGHTSVIDINAENEYEEMQLVHTAEHTRAYIKIQDGCNQFCSYCVIPFARGRVRSRKPEQVEEEVRRLAEAGYHEIVLTGIHLSSYGLDFHGESYNTAGGQGNEQELLRLIGRIHAVDGITRIRLGSLEPRVITEAFAGALAALPKVCPHFHLSLQSGCDGVLKRMNRRYTTEEFARSVEILRRVYEHPAITTDVITGFPGETEEEFAQTVSYLEKIRFFEMHVFPYSRREGTVAADMPGQLTEKEKKQRSSVLLAMTARHSKEYREYYIGKEQEVLFEQCHEIEGRQYLTGHTRNYVRVAVPVEGIDPAEMTNQERICCLTGFADDETLLGTY